MILRWKPLIGLGCVLFAGWSRAQAGEAPHWWESEPLRIVDVVTSLDQTKSRSPAQWAEGKAAQGYNAEHLEIMNFNKGLDDLGFCFQSKVAGKTNQDFLGPYLPEAKKQGLRVMVYFNVHSFSQAFGQQHPEWLQRREDGTPLTGVYVTSTDFCVNSPWREWVFQVLRDLAAYPIDGIFYDGPIFFPDTCYCRYCKDKYQRQHGADLPSKKERKGTSRAGPAGISGGQFGRLPARFPAPAQSR